MRHLTGPSLGLLPLFFAVACSSLVRPNPADCTVSACPEGQQCNLITHRCEAPVPPDGGAAGDMNASMCLQSEPSRVMVQLGKSGTNAEVTVVVTNDGQEQTCGLPCAISVCPKSKLAVRAITPLQTCLAGWEILNCPEGRSCPSISVNSAQLEVQIVQASRINAILATCALRVFDIGTTENLRDVSGAGGVVYIAGDQGTLRRWDGASLQNKGMGTNSLYGLSFYAADQGLLAGVNTWTRITSESERATTPITGTLRGAAITSEKQGWLVGDTMALRWDGAGVSDESPQNKAALEAVSGVGGEFWAVGPTGVFFHEGIGWRPVSNRDLPLHGVFKARWGEVWVVGDKGIVQRSADGGKTFLLVKGAVSGSLRDVWGSSQEDIWIVGDKDGDGGVILRWDGSNFSRVSLPGSGSFYGVWGSGPADVWFVGEGGAVYRYSRL